MSLKSEIETERRRTQAGAGMTSIMSGIDQPGPGRASQLKPAPVPDPGEADRTEWPRCGCGAPVAEDLMELRAYFPSLAPLLCGACYEKANREDDERRRADAENAEHRHRLAELDRVIPPEILETNLGHRTFNAPLWVSVSAWTPESGRWLLVTGTPGLCKTRVAGLLAKRMILEGRRVRWMTAFDLQSAVEDIATFSRGEEQLRAEARSKFREWKHAAVLVLDDLGKNTWNDRLEARLFELIDHRKTHLLPTIVTANSKLTDLLPLMSKERGGPIIGRIHEATAGWQFEAKRKTPPPGER